MDDVRRIRQTYAPQSAGGPAPRPNPDPVIERPKERTEQETAAIDQALEEGRIDEAGWHAAMAALIKSAYLAADNPYAQAGHGGDAATWEASRGCIAEALHHSGAFLDVGCASGIINDRKGDHRRNQAPY